MSSTLKEILDSLKEALNEEGKIKSLLTSQECFCSFNEPVTENHLSQFEKDQGINIPSDFKEFLSLHNGARIYGNLLFGEPAGGGLRLFNLDQMKEAQKYLDTKDIPIAFLLEECHLIINKKKVKKRNPNYLYILEDVDEPRPLNSSFEMFLERYILSQGSVFWDWNASAEVYYRSYPRKDSLF
ncbi:SMI1/KNR4 family protein [Shouchella clausii]|uniref:SMI1/KNR4 family protein n=3 Tax=Shouchella TaxID=2893057 RepID=A0ABZ2CTP9_9BACI|nr:MULTISPECIES: SMI1/KNR4 family protein [Shouchella]MBU3230542.1 SMI1/KNR4 family protein [Shouchella clausii]MBU3262259.1 SMI1/KNR4 family protein [Shouchella clausii]MBU3507426.1 SMI1/KNR4 family protein [Shouchella clausii]MBU3536987.1 SMI1/KNR4 family protein [Shouchella clausii]MBX0306189.1 SMI1/KNR4 family protein [Shouchella clausii]